ncbi:hypothetical protein [Pectinatus frisingensis]|uniref:hypothetical protein n=1 Tax=Pectinatus frisingensis TaxID=865 RepID=UPI0018C6C741|nr:hypothetical protein [Pectinatus frisingensis]
MNREFHPLTRETRNFLSAIVKTYQKYNFDLDKAGDKVSDKFFNVNTFSYHQKTMIDELVEYGYLAEGKTLYPTESGRHYDYLKHYFWLEKSIVPITTAILTSILTTLLTIWLKGL